MDKRKARTKYFRLKELRLSVAHMILWVLLSVALLTFLTIEIGVKIDRTPLYFIIVFAGYAIIVTVLTLLFSHRFLGPFERLKTELRIILSGDYQRRLCIRSKDDFYIRSFISEVDKLLDNLEEMHLFKNELYKNINSELVNIKSVIERREISKEELSEAIVSFLEKIEGLLKDQR